MLARSFVFSATLLLWTLPHMLHATDWKPLPGSGQTQCYDIMGNVVACIPHSPQYGGPALAYQNNGNGTVTDSNTGLMWQQVDDGNRYNWPEAALYCANLIIDGHNDWRLPTRFELRSIVDFGQSVPAQSNVFSWSKANTYSGDDESGIPYTSDTWMRDESFWWTSDLFADDSLWTWTIHFYDGTDNISVNIECVGDTDVCPESWIRHYVRCVRAGL